VLFWVWVEGGGFALFVELFDGKEKRTKGQEGEDYFALPSKACDLVNGIAFEQDGREFAQGTGKEKQKGGNAADGSGKSYESGWYKRNEPQGYYKDEGFTVAGFNELPCFWIFADVVIEFFAKAFAVQNKSNKSANGFAEEGDEASFPKAKEEQIGSRNKKAGNHAQYSNDYVQQDADDKCGGSMIAEKK